MSLVYFLIGIITLGMGIWLIGSYIAMKGLEEPKFSIILEEDGYEIRQYSPYIIAEVEVFGTQEVALNDGFRLLAGYIFGGNTTKASIDKTGAIIDIKQNEKISMTTPVIDISGKNTQHTVQFTMPSGYTMDSLPVPDDTRVVLKEKEAGKVASLRFTGWVSEKRASTKIAELKAMLLKDNYTASSEYSLAQYNPPFSFPLMRRNEILVDID